MADDDMRIVFDGLVFRVLRKSVSVSPGVTKEVEFVESRDVVRVYPISEDGKSIFLIKERQLGQAEQRLRVVSGGIEESENLTEASERELREETGITARDFSHFHTSKQSLKMLNEVFHVIARGAVLKLPPKLEPLEDIEVVETQISSLTDLIWNGAFAEDHVAFGLLKLLEFYL